MSSNFTPTLDLLEAVRLKLAALDLPAPYTELGKAFEECRSYGHNAIGQALSDLQIVSDRVALVVPGGFEHVNERSGQVGTSRRTLEIIVLTADRVYGGNTAEAALGGPTNPGMVFLAELAINTLIAAGDFGLPGNIWMAPTRGQPLLLPAKDQNNETFARECWGQTFQDLRRPHGSGSRTA